jgi:hypothetical protein
MRLEVRFAAQSKGHIERSSYTGCGACPYLLRFDCMCKLLGKRDVRDRDIVQNKVESERAGSEVLPHKTRNLVGITMFSDHIV